MKHRQAPRRHLFLRLLLVVAVCLTGWLVAAGPSGAAPVPDARCARYDQGLRTGICFRDDRGSLYWLGTYRGYDGQELYCIDYLYATRWGVAHERRFFTDRTTSLGDRVGAATVAALTHVVTRHPASTADETTAAAIGLIIRQVMGDVRNAGGHTIPGGLTASSSVRDVGFVGAAVVGRARALWDDARLHRGPWRLTATIDPGPDGKVTVGERVRLVLRGTSGSGRRQDMVATLGYTGFRGPDAVRLGADGVAAVTLTAPRTPTSGRVRARVANAPNAVPVVVRPRDWRVNTSPGHSMSVTQRGLLGRQEAVTASAAATAVVVKRQPRLVTRASASRVEAGATVRDTVTVTGTGGAAGSFAWSLLGPVPARADGTCPGSGDAAWRSASRLASGAVATRGDGSYPTAPYVVRPGDVGCLTYVESMPGTATTLPASTPAGVPAETVLVARRQPRLVTQASAQRAVPGASVHDEVEVSGAGTSAGSFAWSLLGPVPAGPAGCPGADDAAWKQARVLASGSVLTRGDGRYRTPAYVVRTADAGCLTYVESLPATATTLPASTPAGLPSETVLVTVPAPAPVPAARIVRPCVSTVASRQEGLVGLRLHDTVRVGCLRATDRITVRWQAHGPVAPSRFGCDAVRPAAWRGAPVAARGSFTVTGPGTRTTRPFRVREPGCYTFSESVAATATTRATSTRPGLAAETSMLTRRALDRVPQVPTGGRSFAPARDAGLAGLLRIRAAGIRARVEEVGMRGEEMVVPDAPDRIGWLRRSARAGDVIGSSVIAGHVSDDADRPGPFAGLDGVRPGARVEWRDADGRSRWFRVTAVAAYPRSTGLPASVFRTDGPHLLRLVTCTRRIDLRNGGFHYADNLVVTAREERR
ncbi:MAG: class F sortase [Nocardioidaceae bacterium]|nr:class F sortase [Nocardioidaceae bacterium]